MKKNLIRIALLALLISGCNNDNGDNEIVNNPITNNSVNGCDSSNTIFNQLYANVRSIAPNTEYITMDSELHSYSFESDFAGDRLQNRLPKPTHF
ncbi:hypothetical protein [Flavobacterium sp.]|uniref:hypothetical protein n=1 Tax=Flavobacterium sp. TaxID=239 RepID=UPI0039E396CF